MKSCPIRILHFITTLDVGGAETMLLKLVTNSSPMFQHKIVYLKGHGKLAAQFGPYTDAPTPLHLDRKTHATGALRQCLKQVSDYRPEILQSWLYHADLMGLAAAKLMRTPINLWNVRCSDIDFSDYSFSSRMVFKLLTMLSHMPTGIIFNSEKGRTVHQQAGYRSRMSEVIPNGFDMQRFRPNPRAGKRLRLKLKIPQTAPVIGMVARYDPVKRHRCFIEAARILIRHRPDGHYILVGEGVDSENAELFRMIKAANLLKRIHLLGPQSCLPEVYPAFDLHSLTSYSEGFPNVIGEAMACGIPCVATNAGDAATIIGATGLIVPIDRPTLLANAWDKMLKRSNTEMERLQAAARNRIASCFDIRQIVLQYEVLYQGLVASLHNKQFTDESIGDNNRSPSQPRTVHNR